MARKKKLSGKTEFDKLLIEENKSPAYIRRTMAAKFMVYGKKEPSHFPRSRQLRQRKWRAKREDYLDPDPLIALVRMKGDLPYSNVIQDIGFDRFFVHYWSTMEMNNYREYCKLSTKNFN